MHEEHHHRHSPDHGHRHESGIGRLDPHLYRRRDVYRVGRRQFVADLGRRTVAIAILGTGMAACSSDDDGATVTAPSPSPDPTATATAEPTTAPTEPSTEVETVEPVAEDDDGDDQAAEAPTLEWAQVVLGNVSAYVLARGNEAAVVDTGNPGARGDIGSALANLGLNFDDVGHVVLTHRHPDHVGSLDDVLIAAPSATAYAGQADLENIASIRPLQAVGDGDDVFGLDVFNTPGHTPGSISVFDAEIGLLIAGDAMIGNAAGTEINGPSERFSSDLTLATESVKRLAELPVDTVAFGHGNPVIGGAGAALANLADSL